MKTPTTIKNEARAIAFSELCRVFTDGGYSVHRIGDSEIAILIDTTTDGEPIYATLSPVIKDFCDRQTKTKTIKAFDLTAEVEAYKETVAKREAKTEENKKNKAKKIERDKARREANKKAKAEHNKIKADTLTEFKRRKMAEDVNVKVKP